MKKSFIILSLFLTACVGANHNGWYVNHTAGQYSVVDDTLEVKDSTIISHSGFKRIRNGQTLPKEFKTKQVFELHPVFEHSHLLLNNTSYQKIR